MKTWEQHATETTKSICYYFPYWWCRVCGCWLFKHSFKLFHYALRNNPWHHLIYQMEVAIMEARQKIYQWSYGT